MSEDKVKVSKIHIDLPDGKSVELTPEQARDLLNELKNLFGDNVVTHFNWPLEYDRNSERWNPLTPDINRFPSTGDPLPSNPVIWCEANPEP